mmetsp:Transcript_17478/g.39452  ORF Transcript_17478/g.39452 Transcript_17478/m.39452 type:complete len:139 (-) Transcript_17478:778-1194(-)
MPLLVISPKYISLKILGCIYHFLALLYYFGIVKLPSKKDYWSTHSWMPIHPIANAFGMSRDQFQFLWRHFHIDDTESGDAEDILDDEEGGEEDLVELLGQPHPQGIKIFHLDPGDHPVPGQNDDTLFWEICRNTQSQK